MALPHTFAALTTAQMSFLDDNDAALGALTTLQCTAAGTNSITLTPAANAPAIAAYGLPNPVRFGFVASATSTGPVTLRVNALAFLKLFLPSGVQANTGDINATSYYELVYLSTLDSGNGGVVVASALPGTGSAPVANGSAKGLVVTNNAGTPATKVDITAGKTVLVSSTGAPIFLSSFSGTCDLTTTGLNGMDTGSRPASGWVYLYALSNGSLQGTIATQTSPTAGSFSPVPSGYIYSMYVGAMWLDGSSNLFRSKQVGRKTQSIVGTNPAATAVIANGVINTFSETSPAFTPTTTSVATFVPATAGEIQLLVSGHWKGGSVSSVLIAPNTAWGGTQNGPQGSNGNIFPVWLDSAGGTTQMSLIATMVLETMNIFIASSAAGAAIGLLGWTDYYVAA